MFSRRRNILDWKWVALTCVILIGVGCFFYQQSPDGDVNAQAADYELPSSVVAKGESRSKGENESSSKEKEEQITTKTKLILKVHDQTTEELKSQELLMPKEAINLTLQDAREYLEQTYEGCVAQVVNTNQVILEKTIQSDARELANGEETSCYLIKEENNKIKIFYKDKSGALKLIRSTQINYDLLSLTDQELFKYGVVKYSEEEVDALLENFES